MAALSSVASAAGVNSGVSAANKSIPLRAPTTFRLVGVRVNQLQQQQQQRRKKKTGEECVSSSALCTGCQCLLYSVSPVKNVDSQQPCCSSSMALSNVYFDSRMRISFRSAVVGSRRGLLGKGMTVSRRSYNRKGFTTKCMITTANVSTEELSVRSLLEGEEKNSSSEEESVPALPNKPVFTMRPPVRTANKPETDGPGPALKPSPRPALKLRLKGSASSPPPPPPPQAAERINGDFLPQGGGANGNKGSSRISLRRRDEVQADRSGSSSSSNTPNGSNVESSLKVAQPESGTDPVQSLGQILKNVEDREKSNPSQEAAAPSSPGPGPGPALGAAAAPAPAPAPAAAAAAAAPGPALAAAPAPARPAPARKPSFAPPPSRPTAAFVRPPPRQSSTQWRPSDPNSGGPTAAQLESVQEVKREPGNGRDVIQAFRPDATFRAQPRAAPAVTRPKPDSGNGVNGARPPPARKGPILRDVGAAAAAVARGPGAPAPAASTTAAAPKFTKVAPVKGKEDWRKKLVPSVSDGARRRVAAREKDAAVDLDSPVAGKPLARGRARKQTKASRKAVKAEAARASAPVKVEILEVGKEGMSVADLAAKLAVNDGEVVKTLFMKGIATQVNQTLDEETVRLVCNEFDVEVVEAGSIRVEDLAKKRTEFLDEDDLEYLEVRPPVVTIMGHVDHGKTSLLDFIRKSKVAAGEAGGITQGIGAYRVLVPVGEEMEECVFLDTPGHQAFSAMRARGARVTDIAVIVVAADDGVRPQSLEAIAHAKAAGVPFVVAINKMDKEGAQPERVMQELSSHGVMVEDWGGDVPAVQVSAKTGAGVESLLETIMLIAEIQELRANPTRSAKGTVIEARLDKARGTVASLLVQNGTLRKGDVVLCGESYGKVRAMTDDTGANVEEAGPSTAVQVTGLGHVPVAGDEFDIMDTIDEARDKATERAIALREQRLTAQAGEGKVTLSSLGNALAAGDLSSTEHHQLNIVLKVDVQGSVEAIREALQELPQNTVGLRFLMTSVGEVSASDIDLATASEAVVIAFNVAVQSSIQAMAEKQGVEVRTYDVIYELLDDMRKAMEGMLDVVEEEIPLGQAEVRAVFGSGSGRVAGCMVNEGKLVKGCGLKVVRGSSTVYTGVLDSLKRVKETAREVVAGLECGVGISDFAEWQEGDTIEAFTKVEKRRSLEEASVNTVGATANVRSSNER